MKCKILSRYEFDEACKADAYNWLNSGYTADELTENDILSEYPNDYFDTDLTETDEMCCFTPHDFATVTIDYIRELQEV